MKFGRKNMKKIEYQTINLEKSLKKKRL